MKKIHKAIILTLALTALLSFGWVQRAGGAGEKTIETPEPPPVVTAEEKLEKILETKQTETREAWLSELILCESGGRAEAINPKDRDNTPSYGLLQFKPSTFEMFSKAYGIPGELMDPRAQKAIVRRMMDDKSVRWGSQFPDCVRRLGTPPPKPKVICTEDCPLIVP